MECRFFVLFSCSVAFCAAYDIALRPQCGENEELSCVHDQCPYEKSCATRGIQYRCQPPTKKCEDKCICKPDHYRNAIGQCITDQECDSCRGPNEFFTCGGECDNVCSDLATQNRTNCPILNKICNRMCYCIDGYARNYRNKCIPVEKCPKPTCDENEDFVECKRICPPEFCFSLTAKFKCHGEPPCISGCACKSGYLRKDEDSSCEPLCQCPEMKNSPDCKDSQTVRRQPNL